MYLVGFLPNFASTHTCIGIILFICILNTNVTHNSNSPITPPSMIPRSCLHTHHMTMSRPFGLNSAQEGPRFSTNTSDEKPRVEYLPKQKQFIFRKSVVFVNPRSIMPSMRFVPITYSVSETAEALAQGNRDETASPYRQQVSYKMNFRQITARNYSGQFQV